MPITAQPLYDPLPSGRPVVFRSFFTAIAPDTIENCVVTLLYNGAPVATWRKKSFGIAATIPGLVDFLFEVDVARVIRDLQSPNSPSQQIKSTMFGELGTAGNSINLDAHGTAQVQILYERRNGTTGALELVTVTPEVSSLYNVFLATRQHLEPMNLGEFVGIPFVQFGKFLTNSPEVQEICEDENHFLSFLSGWNYARVRLLDASGAIVSTHFFATGGILNQQTTIGVGVPNLNNQTFFISPPNFANPLVVSYQIDAGLGVPIGGPALLFTPNSNVLTFSLKRGCCNNRRARFHWLNLLGGVDSYTFQSVKIRKYNTNSGKATKPLAWDVTNATSPHNSADKGSLKVDSRAVESFEVSSKLLKNPVAFWLKELLSSSEVYIEEGPQYLPVIIEDTEQQTGIQQGFSKFEIVARFSNETIIQQN